MLTQWQTMADALVYTWGAAAGALAGATTGRPRRLPSALERHVLAHACARTLLRAEGVCRAWRDAGRLGGGWRHVAAAHHSRSGLGAAAALAAGAHPQLYALDRLGVPLTVGAAPRHRGAD